MFADSPFTGKDQSLERSRLQERRHYLGVAAETGRACKLGPHFGVAFVVASVGFLFTPPRLFQCILWPRPRNPACIFKNVQLSGIRRQLASPKQSSLIE